MDTLLAAAPPEHLSSDSVAVRYRAVIAYDGSAYQGFQRQSAAPSVQAMLEKALAAATGTESRVLGAARTDTGVHGAGQVIAFDAIWRHADWKLIRALNANLPDDIAVQRIERAEPDFHPRFDATSRVYEYQVYQAETRNPLFARTAWHLIAPLNVVAMNAVAATILGDHDFATFGAPTQGTRTVRTVFGSAWRAEMLTNGARLLTYRVEANAFLQHMVRALVGALTEVGAGAWSPADFAAALAAADRQRGRQLAPPHGLTLIDVTYKTDGVPSASRDVRTDGEFLE